MAKTYKQPRSEDRPKNKYKRKDKLPNANSLKDLKSLEEQDWGFHVEGNKK